MRRARNESGLATIASMTGGDFFLASGKRPACSSGSRPTSSFYQLGVESRSASDADGGASRRGEGLEVRATVRARRKPRSPDSRRNADALKAALAEPIDACRAAGRRRLLCHAQPGSRKVRLTIAVQMAEAANAVPSDGATSSRRTSVIATSQIHVSPNPRQPWAATLAIDVAPGRYRLRTAAVTLDGPDQRARDSAHGRTARGRRRQPVTSSWGH